MASLNSNQKIDLLNSVLTVKGRIFYSDGRRRIDLKKPVTDIFYESERNKSKIFYKMELRLNKEKLRKRTEELLEKGVTPILFYFAENDN